MRLGSRGWPGRIGAAPVFPDSVSAAPQTPQAPGNAHLSLKGEAGFFARETWPGQVLRMEISHLALSLFPQAP